MYEAYSVSSRVTLYSADVDFKPHFGTRRQILIEIVGFGRPSSQDRVRLHKGTKSATGIVLVI